MKTRLIVALYLSGLAALLLARFGLAAQDPGSMASRVQRPASCANGEVLTYNSTSQQYECQPAGGGGGVPAGAILLIVSGSCPSGYAEETALNGRLPLGTLVANADIGTTGGSDNITPAGTVSQPTFTGNALAGHSHTFTGSALSTHSHTFTGTSSTVVVNHTHPVNITDSGHSHGMDEGTTDGSGTFMDRSNAAAATSATTNSATTGITATTSNPGGGSASYTPAGTNSADSAGTPAGSNSSDSAGTLSGTVSQPSFTGTQFDNRAAFVRVIFCRKT